MFDSGRIYYLGTASKRQSDEYSFTQHSRTHVYVAVSLSVNVPEHSASEEAAPPVVA
jgi:hypothetical protein